MTSTSSRTNEPFVKNLYEMFNKHFTIDSEAAINAPNFAPNKRPYSVKPFNSNLNSYFAGANWDY